MTNNKLYIIIWKATVFCQLILIQTLGWEFIMLSNQCIKKPRFIFKELLKFSQKKLNGD